MTFDGDWPIVFLDVAILTELAILAVWFHRGSSVASLKYMSASFVLIGVSKFALVAGDVLLALDYTAADFWLLERPWRALVWRIGSAIGFSAIIGILMFGSFANERKPKNK